VKVEFELADAGWLMAELPREATCARHDWRANPVSGLKLQWPPLVSISLAFTDRLSVCRRQASGSY